jgi:calcineurin-like phosphoesterase family protein
MNPNIFFTADLHYGHKKIIEYCNRPFKTLEEMNEKLIDNWNNIVEIRDIVYILGDFCWSKTQELELLLRRLKGCKKFLIGSHDDSITKLNDNHPGYFPPLTIIGHQFTTTIEGTLITLNHYSMRTWPASHYNSWHLFGHSHGHLEPFGKSFDVGVDTWNFKPVSWNEVKTKMKQMKDNFNLVKK